MIGQLWFPYAKDSEITARLVALVWNGVFYWHIQSDSLLPNTLLKGFSQYGRYGKCFIKIEQFLIGLIVIFKVEQNRSAPPQFIITALCRSMPRYGVYSFEVIHFQRGWQNGKGILAGFQEFFHGFLVGIVFLFGWRIILVKERQEC